jgi:Putative porin
MLKSNFRTLLKRPSISGLALMSALMLCGPAWAQDAAEPSSNAMHNLIRLLVQQKVITQEAGEALIAQAKTEAEDAAAKQAFAAEGVRADVPGTLAAAPPPPEGTVRVPYIPESVRKKIRDEVKDELITKAKAEGWLGGAKLPDWVSKVRWSGDFRMRSQSDFYSDKNKGTTGGEFIDFDAFNTSGPTDVNPNTNPNGVPFLNITENRINRLRFRARLGLTADINSNVEVGVRLASGDDNGPISTNQALGNGFGKKNIWLDRAYLKLKPVDFASLTLGRMGNPFTTTDLLFDEDVNFDGVVVAGNIDNYLPGDLTFGAVLGAFPLEYSGSNFPTQSPTKQDSNTKWLLAGQANIGMKFGDVTGRLSAGYFNYSNITGELSTPCSTFSGLRQCSTDFTRPFFLRKGNTVNFIRVLAPNPTDPSTLRTAQPQLVGLSQEFDILNINAEVNAPVTDTLVASLRGDYARNLSFKRSVACARGARGTPLNNVIAAANGNDDPCTATNPALYQSGPTAWSVRGQFGYTKPKNFGEWQVGLGYRSIDPDAVLDAFADSDFHLGGTNAKGYSLDVTFGLFKNVALTGKWMSANEVSGPPLGIDVLQFDLKAEF